MNDDRGTAVTKSDDGSTTTTNLLSQMLMNSIGRGSNALHTVLINLRFQIHLPIKKSACSKRITATVNMNRNSFVCS